MSRDWYLIGNNTPPRSLGGFENESHMDYKEDAFLETLETDIADTAILYNSDLSESREIRAIFMNNVQNTMLASQNRSVLVPIGTLKTGQYIYWMDHYWLVTGYPGNNHVYEKATIAICQYKIRWQNRKTGDVVERWVNFSTASKYSIGEYRTDYNVTPTNDFIALVPQDDETILLDDRRVFVDTKENDPYKVYKLTRNDDPIYYYDQHGAILNFIVDRESLDTSRDNVELRLCDYFVPEQDPASNDPHHTLRYGHITGPQTLRIGRQKTYTVTFTGIDGNPYPIDRVAYEWRIDSTFADAIKIVDQHETDGTITLLISDSAYMDESFKLQVYVEGYFNTEMVIAVRDLF